MQMNVYFVQPMKGLSGEEIMRQRREAKAAVEIAIGGKVKEAPKLIQDMEHGAVYNLGKAVQQMDGVELVACLPGWEEHGGCRIEMACAENYGYEVTELKDSGDGGYLCEMGQMHL